MTSCDLLLDHMTSCELEGVGRYRWEHVCLTIPPWIHEECTTKDFAFCVKWTCVFLSLFCSMPYAQSHYPFENKKAFEAAFPADFIAEGIDQTRGWCVCVCVCVCV